MDSSLARGPLRTALYSSVVFGCGIGAYAAWQAGLYTNALLAALLGIWIGTLLSRAASGAPDRPVRQVTEAAPVTPGLAAEIHLLRATLEQVPSPLVTLTQGGKLHAINRAARALLATDDLVTDPPPALATAIRDAAAGHRRMVKLDAAGGRVMSVSSATVFTAEGPNVLAVLADLQADIRTAEANALRELMAVLGHEIMNALTPVASLAGSAYTMMKDATPEGLEQVRDALEIIQRRTEGLDSFVQGYRALARVPAPNLRPVRVCDVVREAAALFEASWARRGVSLHVEVRPQDVVARMDAGLIGQALLNLLANGAEAALARGTAPEVRLAAGTSQAGLVFSVTDNGCGIDPGREIEIFTPFITSKPGGTGIGLSLSRQIASSHGGSLILEPTDDGCGARFVLTIP